MANIVETVVGDRRIQLGNEEFVRTIGVRTNWTKLRIGMRLSFNSVGGNILNAAFVLGLCEGSTATYYNNNTTGFWGVGCANPLASTTYVYGTTYYQCGAGNVSAVTRIGNVTTSSQLTVGGDVPYFLINPTHGTLYLDLDKSYQGSGQRATLWWNNNVTHNYDHSQTEFYQAMEYEFLGGSPNTIPGARNYNGPLVFNYAGNVNNLDTLSISWNKSTPTVEISDLMVLRFS